MSDTFLKQKDLARRWGISHRTLERWRVIGHGPRFVKVGSNVVYRLSDVEAYERKRVRTSTRMSGSPDVGA
jgi:predicted DNA-binding transcriptional regulator AlpA